MAKSKKSTGTRKGGRSRPSVKRGMAKPSAKKPGKKR